MNVDEVRELLERHDEDGEGSWYTWHYRSPSRDGSLEASEKIEGLGSVEVVETEGGGEGEGEHVHIVFRISEEYGAVRYYKKEAYYQSYDGITWDGDFYEVAPTAKMVTIYDRVAA